MNLLRPEHTLGVVRSIMLGSAVLLRHDKPWPYNQDRYAHCIGAFAWFVENPGAELDEAVQHVITHSSVHSELNRLYFPFEVRRMELITRKQAAAAIQNWRTSRDPKWLEVVNG